MATKRPSESPGEKERFEVLLEEMRSQFKLVLESLSQLTERVEQLEHRVNRMEQKLDLFGSALLGHSNEIQGLRRDVRALTERMEAHERLHAGR